jgi:hypothetical protein
MKKGRTRSEGNHGEPAADKCEPSTRNRWPGDFCFFRRLYRYHLKSARFDVAHLFLSVFSLFHQIPTVGFSVVHFQIIRNMLLVGEHGSMTDHFGWSRECLKKLVFSLC